MNPGLFTRAEDKRKVTLPGGVTLLSEVLPAALSVSVGVWIRSGSRHEGPAQRGISHFLEHMVFKGTENRSAYEIALSLDRRGGQLDAFTTKEYTCFSARVLVEDLPVALDLLADLVLRARLDEDMVELEKRVVVEEIQGVLDDPDDWIHDLASEEIYGSHPMARPILGDEEAVSAFRPEQLRRWMSERYTGQGTVISVAGPLEHDAVRRQVEALFPMEAGPALEPADGTPPEPERRLRHVSRDLQQQHLWLGRLGIGYAHPDRYALLLLATLLGGSMSSRLFQSIRERAALAYNVFSYADFASDTGSLGTYMAVSPARTGEALRLTLDEFVRLISQSVGEEELSDARMQLKGNMLIALESLPARMARMAKNELAYGRFLEIGELVERVDAVSVEDLRRLAAEFLDPATLSLVSLGPNPDTGTF